MSKPVTLHASCVALDDRGLLITGSSGSGKSTLALQLMAYGALLVSDDYVELRADGDRLMAAAPDTIARLIEARGIGILNAAYAPNVPIIAVLDLDHIEVERIPARREVTIANCTIPLLHKVEGIHFAPAILQFLRGGWSDR